MKVSPSNFPWFFFLSEDNNPAKFEAYSFRHFWVTQSQQRDWSIFFERGLEGGKKNSVSDFEAEKLVELYEFQLSKKEKEKSSAPDETWSHFQANSLCVCDEKDEYPEMSE